MPKSFIERRLRFSVEQDLQLLKEVVRQNPFEDISKWKEVHENFVNQSNVPFSFRTVKDHLNHLLSLFLKESVKRRPRESVPQFKKKQQLLSDILTLRRKGKGEGYDVEDGDGSTLSNINWDKDSDAETDPLKDLLKLEPQDTMRDGDDLREDSWDFLKGKSDIEAKLKKKELALEARKLALKERQLKLAEEKFELEKMERTKRMEIGRAERELYMKVVMQNQAIIAALVDKRNRNGSNQNLCIL